MGSGLNRVSERMTKAMFWSVAALKGVSLSTVVLAYTGVSIARTFFVAPSAFAGHSLWGYTTKKNLSAWGSLLMMGVFKPIIAMILDLFFRSAAMDFAASANGVLLFADLTAYDTKG
jgi:FtsH-binding integral membrane protein